MKAWTWTVAILIAVSALSKAHALAKQKQQVFSPREMAIDVVMNAAMLIWLAAVWA